MKGLDDMLILSRVCVDFHNRKGEVVHRVTPANRLTFHEAPDSIQEDPIFQMLVNEGSLEAGVTAAKKKILEQDPTAGSLADGKKIRPETEAVPAETKAKAGKAEEKPAEVQKK